MILNFKYFKYKINIKNSIITKDRIAFLLIAGFVYFLFSAFLIINTMSYPINQRNLTKLAKYNYKLAEIIKQNNKLSPVGKIKSKRDVSALINITKQKKYKHINANSNINKTDYNTNYPYKTDYKPRYLNYFKEGYKFYKAGNYKKATGLFWLYTAKRGKFLYDYSLYYQGLCFIKTRNYYKANFVLSRLAQYYPHFIFYKNAVFYLAEAQYKIGDYNGALNNFKHLLYITGNNRIKPYSYKKIANIYLLKHKYKEAKLYIAKIYINYPYYYKIHHIVNLLPKIKSFKKSGKFNLTQNQKLKRALNLYYDSYYAESYKTIAGIKGNKAEIIRLKDMLKLKNPQFLNPLALFKSDLKKENLNKEKESTKKYQKYLKLIPYLKAYYFHLTGNNAETIKILNKIFYSYGYLNKKESDMYQNILWHEVLNNLKRNELIQARKNLLKLIKIASGKSPNYPKYLFWYGIDLKKLNLIKYAAFYFKTANAIAPLSYYGIMSKFELGYDVINFKKAGYHYLKLKENTDNNINDVNDKFSINIDIRTYMLLKTFLKLKIFTLAGYELNKILEIHKIKENKYFLIKLVNLFNKYKDYKDAASLSSFLINNKFLSRQFLDFLYPRPFYDYAKKYAEKYNVPVNLIYSIMRQESLFDPVCSSGAGAIGLMQIMSPTGYYIANKVGCAYFSPHYLYNRSLNIKFGSYYISSLLNEFGKKKYLAIASYNAGPGAVSYWKNNILNNENKLLFIESIPFNQTRNYVKMVLRNYYVYNALYGR
ncbi:MAG: lytic transglycosylase domain-containing protein [bacterium]